MPKENRKRGRRGEKKRKRDDEELDIYDEPPKRQKSEDAEEEVEIIVNGKDDGTLNEAGQQDDSVMWSGPGDLPFYGLLDEEEQEYFKRADSLLEVNQFGDQQERDLFLANVYKEASGKELKIANSQSCSRLMERLILLSTPNQLKTLFQRFSGHFLNLFQHRFASHCCEALFLRAAPLVTQEMIAPTKPEKPEQDIGDVFVSMENLFLFTLNELDGNLGYLMTDQFASHPLRVLLIVLSGKPLAATNSTTLLQSKKKEHVTVSGGDTISNREKTQPRAVPSAFQVALDKTIVGTVAGLDTSSLRALATHPIANPVIQLLLELELKRSEKQSAKYPDSIFRKLLPDDPLVEGTESVSFINSMIYDIIGSRLVEIIVTNAPGKTFKALYRCSFGEKIGTLAKNETASFVLNKVIQRLNKDDLQAAVDEINPQIDILIKRSRTSIIKTLIERCRVRQVDMQSISTQLKIAYGDEPSETLVSMLKVNEAPPQDMAADRRKQLENQDSSKVHASLLAQCMLESPGPLRELILDGLFALETPALLNIAKDRTASRVIQSALTCADQTPKFRRSFIPQLFGHMGDLATDIVASHVVDSLWEGSAGLTFIREKIAEELARNETSLRASIPGRAVWRNWKMDIYKTRRTQWLNEAKGQDGRAKTGLELARERFATDKGPEMQKKSRLKAHKGSGANNTPISV